MWFCIPPLVETYALFGYNEAGRLKTFWYCSEGGDMRTTILIVFAVLILVCVPAIAAGDHVELYNIGVTVSMEEEQTTISLFLDGMIEPRKIDTEEESILIFDLPDVELTAADEGGTSFMVFSPSVASIKLTQLETDPFLTRLEIYTNDLREYTIETVATGIDFIIFPVGLN